MAENDKDHAGEYETYVAGRRYDPDTWRLDGAIRVLDELCAEREAKQRKETESKE